jgi:cytoskeletal protein RodZ
MATLGTHLKEARLARGIGLAEIADETKISARYLRAVEDEDLRALPGALFARNFARQYAAYLGVGGQEVEDRIREAFPLVDAPVFPVAPETSAPIRVEPLSEDRVWQAANLRRMALSLVALAAVAGAGSAVYRLWQEVPQMVEVARQEAQQAQQAPGNQRSPAPANHPAASGRMVPAAAGTASAGSETTITIAGSGMAVQLVATDKAWVSVTANGKRIFRGILEPNERKTVAGVENAKIVVGNAGALQVLTDGRDIGPIGGEGQVRVIILSPEGPQILPQTPAPGGERRTSS